MVAVTPPPACLSVLDELLDREHSRRFHRGELAIDPAVARDLLARLEPLGRPAVAVHVAGSEGKTSTTERIAAGLAAAGLSVGSYTSPHLHDVRERLRIDGAFPPDVVLADAVATVRAAAHDLRPSYFEFLTAMARVLFVPPRVAAAVWETGLGGRLDATRHLPADLCVITSISLEHTAVLGDTLAAVAGEKAGILRPGVPLVVAATLPDEARAVIDDRALHHCCEVIVAEDGAADLPGRNIVIARTALDVLAGCGLVPALDESGARAVTACVVAGRLQEIDGVLYDGAHTVEAATMLAAHIFAQRDSQSVAHRAGHPVGALLFGATSGRDADAMLAALRPLTEHLVLTRVPGDRGVEPSALAPRWPGATVEPQPERALALARRQAGPDRLVVVTGSLHLVGLLLPDTCFPDRSPVA